MAIPNSWLMIWSYMILLFYFYMIFCLFLWSFLMLFFSSLLIFLSFFPSDPSLCTKVTTSRFLRGWRCRSWSQVPAVLVGKQVSNKRKKDGKKFPYFNVYGKIDVWICIHTYVLKSFKNCQVDESQDWQCSTIYWFAVICRHQVMAVWESCLSRTYPRWGFNL